MIQAVGRKLICIDFFNKILLLEMLEIKYFLPKHFLVSFCHHGSVVERFIGNEEAASSILADGIDLLIGYI